MRKILLATLPLLLTACVRDGATYYVDGGASNNHTLSLRRDQDYFWSDNVRLTLVAARLPECQRQIALGEMYKDEVEMDVLAAGDNQWSLRNGEQVWQVETQTCALVSESGPAAGQKVGQFKVADGKLVFEAAAAPAAGADPAAPAAPAAAAPDAGAAEAAPAQAAPPVN